MNVAAEIQHDNFARQLSALEKLLIISHSRLSLEELHKNIKVRVVSYHPAISHII